MSTESEQSRHPTEPRRRFQFTLRTLLGATAAISVVFAAAEMVDPAFAGGLVRFLSRPVTWPTTPRQSPLARFSPIRFLSRANPNVAQAVSKGNDDIKAPYAHGGIVFAVCIVCYTAALVGVGVASLGGLLIVPLAIAAALVAV